VKQKSQNITTMDDAKGEEEQSGQKIVLKITPHWAWIIFGLFSKFRPKWQFMKSSKFIKREKY